ncbi:MAG: ATP-binding protein [Thermoanaerobaculia bacterium]
MDPDAKDLQPEREHTDTSLREERESVDGATKKKRVGLEAIADEIVERARDQADAVLGTARDMADLAMRDTDTGAHAQVTIERERTLEDGVLQDERAAADEVLRRERAELDRTLAALLPLERQRTDRNLRTERSRADDQLASRDDFLGMVSHDVRNLLCGVVLETALLGEESAPDTEVGRRTIDSVSRIQRYLARISGLIGDLVDVVSIDAGKLAIRPRRGDVQVLLREIADAFASMAREKGLILEIEFSEGPLLADFDHNRILQILANLVSNAIKFTPEGGNVQLRAETVGGDLRFAVTDTGIGIREDLLEAIFDRFWQVGAHDGRGLGLGLYISKCIVEAHGGTIWAESKLGEGSTFRVSIPRLAASLAA